MPGSYLRASADVSSLVAAASWASPDLALAGSSEEEDRPQPGGPENEGTIMTNDNTSRHRPRIMAGATLVTAAAAVASLLSASAPAIAAPDEYVAISVGIANETPPVRTIGGVGNDADADKARAESLSGCQSAGGGQCVFEIIAPHGCVSAAANDYGEIATAEGGLFEATGNAEKDALSKLQSQQGAHIVISGCANGYVQQPGPPPAPPAPPKLGPTVTFKTIVGGLEALITDRSGVASQCTYVMDDLSRSFALAAKSTFDLRIVPAIPRFRDRNVTITCDNGTKTEATTRF
jgi:hypothetical protein